MEDFGLKGDFRHISSLFLAYTHTAAASLLSKYLDTFITVLERKGKVLYLLVRVITSFWSNPCL